MRNNVKGRNAFASLADTDILPVPGRLPTTWKQIKVKGRKVIASFMGNDLFPTAGRLP